MAEAGFFLFEPRFTRLTGETANFTSEVKTEVKVYDGSSWSDQSSGWESNIDIYY
jgi:hypothetical protein